MQDNTKGFSDSTRTSKLIKWRKKRPKQAALNICEKGMHRVVESSHLMPFRSSCLTLDTKYSKEDTKLCSSVEHISRENSKSTFFHQDHIWENKAYNILKSFLTSLYYSTRILPQFIITVEYNNVIRVTEEAGLLYWHGGALT